MGFFDTVYCKYPLPDPRHQDLAFQTKSLECLMDTYTINRDGFSELYIRTLDTDGKPLITVMGKKEAPVQLPGKGIVGGLQFSKDNSKLAFTFNGARYNSDVWLYDLKTHKLSQVTHSSRRPPSLLARTVCSTCWRALRSLTAS